MLELGLQSYIFQDNDVDTLNEAPISTAEKERAIFPREGDANDLLSDLLSLIESEGHLEMSNDVNITSPFIQDLCAEHLSSQVSPWQTTDGWLCRSVQQRQGDETVGYATLWAYATPEQTEPVFQSGQTAMEAIATLLKHTSDAVQSELEQHLPQVQQSLSMFSDELISALEQVDWETLLAIDDDSDAESPEENRRSDRPISEVVKQFFDEDDWSYIIVQNLEEPTPNSQEGDRSSQNPKSKIQNPPTPSPSQEGDRSSQNPKDSSEN